METLTVSPKFQIVIPKALRRQLHIEVGQKLKARVQGEHIEIFLERPMSAARGFLPGLDTTVARESDRV